MCREKLELVSITKRIYLGLISRSTSISFFTVITKCVQASMFNAINRSIISTIKISSERRRSMVNLSFFRGIFLEREETALVILAPYGINGMLLAPVNREMDTNYLRDNWEKNYPIRHLDNLPDFVEVSIGMDESGSPCESNFSIGIDDVFFFKEMSECFIPLVMYIKSIELNREHHRQKSRTRRNRKYQYLPQRPLQERISTRIKRTTLSSKRLQIIY